LDRFEVPEVALSGAGAELPHFPFSLASEHVTQRKQSEIQKYHNPVGGHKVGPGTHRLAIPDPVEVHSVLHPEGQLPRTGLHVVPCSGLPPWRPLFCSSLARAVRRAPAEHPETVLRPRSRGRAHGDGRTRGPRPRAAGWLTPAAAGRGPGRKQAVEQGEGGSQV